VGEGPEEPKVRDVVRELNLEERVRFLGLRKDVARLLGAADVFLLTSTSEGIPLTVIEAMAAGLPVVGTRLGGMAEGGEDGSTGLLTPSGDAAGLAGHLGKLAEDPALRRRMGERGRERARERFSEARMHEAYARVYEEMAGG